LPGSADPCSAILTGCGGYGDGNQSRSLRATMRKTVRRNGTTAATVDQSDAPARCADEGYFHSSWAGRGFESRPDLVVR
jgi:hypothetical protein